jgi:4-amino-4-deoxy-L-arabinose transferase-like glycosyltransferase
MTKRPARNALLLCGSLLVLGLSAWFFLWNIGASSISLRSDEVIYTRITQGILHTGELFPLMHGNVPTFEKPPLKLWLSALAPLMLGESNFSFRVLDGCLGVATVGLTVALALTLTRSAALALLSGALLLGMPELVISHHGFRRAVLDGLLSLLTLGSAWLTWRAIRQEQSGEGATNAYRWISAVCSLAVLTKSVAGFVPALCAMCAIAVCLPTSRKIWRDKEWWGIIGLPAWTFLLYGYVLAIVGGIKALEVFLGVELVTRIFSGFEGHNAGQKGFYLWYLFVRGAAAPRLLLLAGMCGALLSIKNDLRFRYLLIWCFVPVMLYSLAASRVPWYLNPFLPLLAILSVAGASALVAHTRSFLISRWPHVPSRGLTLTLGILLALITLPAYGRAIARHTQVVSTDTNRLGVDLLVNRLREEYSHFVIINNALSGRTQPRNGRFNVEGIYREMLKPQLRTVKSIEKFEAVPGEVALVKSSQLAKLPPGWREVGRAEPFGDRAWAVVAVVYENPRSPDEPRG